MCLKGDVFIFTKTFQPIVNKTFAAQRLDARALSCLGLSSKPASGFWAKPNFREGSYGGIPSDRGRVL